MKIQSILFLAFVVLALSCSKGSDDKGSCFDKQCDVCSVDEAFADLNSGNYEEVVVKELVEDASCGCIVSGVVKYLEDGQTYAMIEYGDGECDQYAVRTNCPNGDCKSKSAECCKFMMDCGGNQFD